MFEPKYIKLDRDAQGVLRLDGAPMLIVPTLGEDFPPNKILGIALPIPGILLVQWSSMQQTGPAKPATETAEG